MIIRILVRFRVDAILLCVYFSVPFIFMFFFFFFDKKTESKGIHMLLDNKSSLKNAASVTLTIVVNDF